MPTIHDVLLTSIRWLLGLTAGTISALLLSLLEFLLLRQRASAYFSRLLVLAAHFLRALPVIALVPLVQYLGVNERWKVALIAWAVTFPIWIAVRQVLATEMIDTELTLVGAQIKERDILLHYQLPKAITGIFRGVEISIGIGWISVVAAEWVGTYTEGFWAGGLGYRIEMAHNYNNWAGMFACLGLFGLLGIATTIAWRNLIRLPLGMFEFRAAATS